MFKTFAQSPATQQSALPPAVSGILISGMTLAVTLAAFVPAIAQTVPVYKLGYDSAFLPFSGLKDGTAQGVAVDILREASQRAKLNIELIPLSFLERMDAIKTRRVDGLFPFPDSAEYRSFLDFSEPLVSTGGALFVRSPQATPSGLDSLNGKIVATPNGGPLAAYIKSVAPQIKLVTTDDYDQTLDMLVAESTDAAALNLQVGSQLVNRKFPGKITLPDRPFLELPLAIGVLKGAFPNFMSNIAVGLNSMKADGSMQAIIQRWK